MKLLLLSTICFVITNISLAIKPIKEYLSYPDTSLINFEEFKIISKTNNDTIVTWKYSPKKSNENSSKTIILSYGDYGNMSYFINQATILTQLGFNVITYDYRGFGSSSYLNIDETNLYYEEFVDDLKLVIKYYSSIKPNSFVLYGLSMGSYISLRAAIDLKINNEINISHIVLEGALLNPAKISKGLIKLGKRSTLPLNNQKIHFKNLKKYKVLVFKGKNDELINSQLNPFKLFFSGWKIKTYKGGHLQALQKLTKNYFGDIYFSKIIEFINS